MPENSIILYILFDIEFIDTLLSLVKIILDIIIHNFKRVGVLSIHFDAGVHVEGRGKVLTNAM